MNDSLQPYLIEWITRNSHPTDLPITAETNLSLHGVLDSLQLMDLITDIEETFHIQIPLEQMLEENFQSVGAIVQMLKQLK